jgi:ABC-type transport system substrate-binding protein
MPGGINTPSLAESWTQSKDGLTYEFVLRKGVKFHNGEPVTPADVKFSFERYKGAGAKLLKERVREVQVVDPGRVRFVLKEPWPDFMTFYGTSATGSGWVVPKAYVEKVGEDGFKRAPIGAGPYKFVSFTPGIELVMEAYEGYWRKVPKVKRLVLRSMPDETTRAAALKKGDVDIAYLLTGPVAEDVQRTPGFKLVAPKESQGTFWLDLPDQWDPKSPWHDRRVRQAASHAIDRKALNQAETLGFSFPTGSLIPRVLEFSRFFEPDAYDPPKAKRLLAEAGYPNGFDAGDLYPWPPYDSMGEALAGYLQSVGIRTKIRSMERAGHVDGVAREEAQERDRGHHRRGRQCRHPARRVRQQERRLYIRSDSRGRGSLPAPGARDGREEARSPRPPDPGHPPRAGDPHPDLRAGLHLGRGSAHGGAGDQPDPELRVLGPAGGPAAEAAVRRAARHAVAECIILVGLQARARPRSTGSASPAARARGQVDARVVARDAPISDRGEVAGDAPRPRYRPRSRCRCHRSWR